MDNLLLFLVVDSLLLAVLVGLISYHVRQSRRERQKTEHIKEQLERERAKTNKFHVDIEQIKRMTKG